MCALGRQSAVRQVKLSKTAREERCWDSGEDDSGVGRGPEVERKEPEEVLQDNR